MFSGPIGKGDFWYVFRPLSCKLLALHNISYCVNLAATSSKSRTKLKSVILCYKTCMFIQKGSSFVCKDTACGIGL